MNARRGYGLPSEDPPATDAAPGADFPGWSWRSRSSSPGGLSRGRTRPDRRVGGSPVELAQESDPNSAYPCLRSGRGAT